MNIISFSWHSLFKIIATKDTAEEYLSVITGFFFSLTSAFPDCENEMTEERATEQQVTEEPRKGKSSSSSNTVIEFVYEGLIMGCSWRRSCVCG